MIKNVFLTIIVQRWGCIYNRSLCARRLVWFGSVIFFEYEATLTCQNTRDASKMLKFFQPFLGHHYKYSQPAKKGNFTLNFKSNSILVEKYIKF